MRHADWSAPSKDRNQNAAQIVEKLERVETNVACESGRALVFHTYYYPSQRCPWLRACINGRLVGIRAGHLGIPYVSGDEAPRRRRCFSQAAAPHWSPQRL